MEIPMDLKTLAILVAVLLFLISLLINLLQRRYHKRDTQRWIDKGESTLNSLNGLHASLGKLESACTLEMEPADSPQTMGKSIHVARNKLKSCMTDVEKNLRSSRTYRRIQREREKQRKRLEKTRKKRLGG